MIDLIKIKDYITNRKFTLLLDRFIERYILKLLIPLNFYLWFYFK
jgi:hypothetical protein